MKFIATIAALIAAFALAACSEKPVEQAMKDHGNVTKDKAFSFQTVEEQRAQGRANAGAAAERGSGAHHGQYGQRGG